ncbi:MAG: hypothetical protein HC804_05875, partial [Anaerolineae bacterium]|nr:hypothetical protein [Anaerolineae bacterium]
MEYTLSLALFDFVPVILSGIGLLFLAQMISRLDATSGKIAYLAGVFIVLGGLSKAVWKTTYVVSDTDIAWMNNLLFIFLAPGFTLLSWAIWSGQQKLAGKEIPKHVWLRPLAIIALFGIGAISAAIAQPEERYWFFILLTLTTFANLAVAALLIIQSRNQGLSLAVGLYLFNIVAVFMLSGMARIPEQTAALQWIEESINAFSQG